MMAVLSAAGIIGGTFAVCCATRLPAHRDRIELLAGLLLVSGLVLVGAGLPIAR